MKKTAIHLLISGSIILIVGLLIPSSIFADVTIYGEGTYTEDELSINIYADITSPTVLRSAGVKLTYDPTEMIVASAEKDGSVWYIDNESYMNPDADKPGEVVVLTFKIDTLDPSAGVSGEHVLIGNVTFIPPSQGTIPETPTLGLDYGKRGSQNQYGNFVDTNLGALDDTAAITFGSITITEPGDPEITVHAYTNTGTDLEGVPVYAFTDAGTYTGTSATTDENGIAHFDINDFPDNSYKFRADYLSYQFWSEVIAVPGASSATIEISEEITTVRVIQAGSAKQGVTVYLFNANGIYLGIYGTTDENGEVAFDLTSGSDFKFRADDLGSQFWSDVITVTEGGVNIIDVDTGGGILTVTVDKGEGTPIPDINVYLFKGDGTSYLGLTHQTDANGQTGFDVCSGSYLVRADYLGYQFWSAEIAVTGDDNLIIPILHQDVTITVQGDDNGNVQVIEDIEVYLFTSADTYLGQSLIPDAQGQVTFNVPEKDYKVRADVMTQQYWSDVFLWTDETVTINEGMAVVTMTHMGLPVDGVSVYVFTSAGTYLGLNDVTDLNGETSFRLPEGEYSFRGDYMGSQYWSNLSTVIPHVENPVTISAGGGAFTLTVLKGQDDPLEGVGCYLFMDTGTYLGDHEVTSSEGEVVFNLADGSYKIRVDHMGYQFWTDIFTVPDNLSMTHTISHQDVMITVQGDYNGDIQPRENLNVYLFTESGTYMNWNETTDSQGEVFFNVPEEAYKVRADYMDEQYWSDDFTWTDKAVTINEGMAEVQVTIGSAPVENVPVYVFTELEVSLGINALTDENGTVSFRLPEGTYKFRADHLGSQYWATEPVTAHQVNSINVDTGGGSFSLTVETQGSVPITNTPVYVFTSGGSYLGLNAQTDAQGQVSFELSDGEYKFRADYLGYQFWSNVSTVPTTLSDVLIISHQDVTITVESLYQAPAEPIEGVRVHLFKESGTYLGQHADTNSQGEATFSLPDQSYKVRADYLGYQFWSDPFVWTATNVTINHGMAVLHVIQGGVDVVDAPVHLFTAAGSYLGKSENTDANGLAEFLLPDQTYKFRVDHDSAQYWSDEITILPNEENQIELDLDLLALDVTNDPFYARFDGTQPAFEPKPIQLATIDLLSRLDIGTIFSQNPSEQQGSSHFDSLRIYQKTNDEIGFIEEYKARRRSILGQRN